MLFGIVRSVIGKSTLRDQIWQAKGNDAKRKKERKWAKTIFSRSSMKDKQSAKLSWEGRRGCERYYRYCGCVIRQAEAPPLLVIWELTFRRKYFPALARLGIILQAKHDFFRGNFLPISPLHCKRVTGIVVRWCSVVRVFTIYCALKRFDRSFTGEKKRRQEWAPSQFAWYL